MVPSPSRVSTAVVIHIRFSPSAVQPLLLTLCACMRACAPCDPLCQPQFILIMFIFAFLLLITVVFLLRPLVCIARHAIAPPHKPVHMSSV